MRDDPIGRRKAELLIRHLSLPGSRVGPATSAHALSPQDWSDLMAAALTAQLYPALIHALNRCDRSAFTAEDLQRRHAPPVRNFRYRNASQRRQLIAAVRALNSAAVEPLLACGARELWLEAPCWRFVQEIELLIPADTRQTAAAALESAGWQLVRTLLSSGYRAETWWVLRGTTGHIALRGIGDHRAIQAVLGPIEGERTCRICDDDGAAAWLMSSSAHCLHAVVSQHCAPVSRGGTIAALKPLYEFTTDLIGLQPAEWRECQALVSDNAELRSIFDMWIEAACRTFGLPREPPFDRACEVVAPPQLVDVSGQFHVALGAGGGRQA